jgi:hypothetical protein
MFIQQGKTRSLTSARERRLDGRSSNMDFYIVPNFFLWGDQRGQSPPQCTILPKRNRSKMLTGTNKPSETKAY